MLGLRYYACDRWEHPEIPVLKTQEGNILVYMEDGGISLKKAVAYWQMGGFVFTAVAGTLMHFLFDWTGGNVVAALFSAVNESIWEHLKLLFYPMVMVAVVEYFLWGRAIDSFWCIKLIGILTGLVLIPVVYYGYTGMLGVNADWFNIAIFFLAAGGSFWLETKLFQIGYSCRRSPKLAVAAICLMAVAFAVFTFVPPRFSFFQDPVTGTYGFQAPPMEGLFYGKRTGRCE